MFVGSHCFNWGTVETFLKITSSVFLADNYAFMYICIYHCVHRSWNSAVTSEIRFFETEVHLE